MPSEIEQEALEFLAKGGDLGLVGVTIADLRVPRLEFLEFDDLDEAMHFYAELIVDKAMTALVTTTYPVHEWDRRTK